MPGAISQLPAVTKTERKKKLPTGRSGFKPTGCCRSRAAVSPQNYKVHRLAQMRRTSCRFMFDNSCWRSSMCVCVCERGECKLERPRDISLHISKKTTRRRRWLMSFVTSRFPISLGKQPPILWGSAWASSLSGCRQRPRHGQGDPRQPLTFY